MSGLLFKSPGFSGKSLSGITVLGLAADGYACGNYRINYPLQVLSSEGAKVTVRDVSTSPHTMEEVLEADVIYCQRFTDPHLCKLLSDVRQAKGTKIIYDLDDALVCIPPASPAFNSFNPGTKIGQEHLKGVEAFLELADTVIFSTRELQAVYSQYKHKSYIILNGLDLTLGTRVWDSVPEEYDGAHLDWKNEACKQGLGPLKDSLLLGVAGGKTHFHDWKLLSDSLERVTKESSAFVGIQADPAVVDELLATYWKNIRHRVVTFKPETYEKYPVTLAKFNINLAPLQNNRFNLSKTNLRLIELGAWGVPYVASAVAPFQRFHKENLGDCGELAVGTDFASPVLNLINDKRLRHRKATAIKGFVRNHYNVNETAKSLPHIIRATLLGAKTLSSLQISDERLGIPVVKFPLKSISPCPCGNSRPYGQCCTPAFGRL